MRSILGRNIISIIASALLCLCVLANEKEDVVKGKKIIEKVKLVKVLMKTSMGDVEIELDAEKAPLTVKNFLSYVDKKYYDNLIFHRVIKDFMVQGGGFDSNMKQKATDAPVKNEASNGLTNEVGSVAMARTSDPHSATSQFYINVKENNFLNYKSDAQMGYTVFGRVIKGMPVFKKMELVKTAMKNGHSDVPVDPIVIKSIERLK